jgi:hypothetical protein
MIIYSVVGLIGRSCNTLTSNRIDFSAEDGDKSTVSETIFQIQIRALVHVPEISYCTESRGLE